MRRGRRPRYGAALSQVSTTSTISGMTGMSTVKTPRSRFRLVDRYTVHGGVAPLVERICDLIPPETDFVVLDLDKTVHLGVTLGEVLGWEILSDPRCARAFVDSDAEADPEPFFALRRPVSSTVNFIRGLRDWGLAGLMYATTVKAGNRWAAWDHVLARHLGSEYVNAVQAVLRNVLMARASSYSAGQLEAFAERAWRRSRHRLVIDAEVVRRIRDHCPGLKAVIVSSASTAPTVTHAAAQLGVDGFISSDVDHYDREGERLSSSPTSVSRWFMVRRPRQLSRPGAVFHNSSVEKVRLLHMHHPEMFADGVVSVGISDNNFGEDRHWPDYFTHAVALNSTNPFSPFVGAHSPCRSIAVVDASPIGARPIGDRKLGWHGSLADRQLVASELAGSLGERCLERLTELETSLQSERQRLACGPETTPRLELAEVGARIAAAVDVYNESTGSERAAAARRLHALERRLRQLRRDLDRSTRGCSIVQHALAVHLRRAGIEITGRGAQIAA